jgi:hypothetical protein
MCGYGRSMYMPFSGNSLYACASLVLGNDLGDLLGRQPVLRLSSSVRLLTWSVAEQGRQGCRQTFDQT